MKLTRKQFDVLSALAENGERLSQRSLEEKSGHSLGTVNKVLKDLDEAGYTDNGAITAAGLTALEPYRVKRAVFIAAGFGSRLVPITLNTPKPLVRVNGTRIIDTLIDACLGAGIDEIYVVRGYLAEQFDQLLYKYPMIKFLENPSYNEANNISSAIVARYLFSSAYIFEADLLLREPKLIKKYMYASNFLGIRKDRTDDWCFTVKNREIVSQRIGGIDCYQEVGISFWSEEDGLRLAEHLKQAYEMPGGKELFWDKVPMEIFKKQYHVEIRECNDGDVTEIDTFSELKALDSSYDV